RRRVRRRHHSRGGCGGAQGEWRERNLYAGREHAGHRRLGAAEHSKELNRIRRRLESPARRTPRTVMERRPLMIVGSGPAGAATALALYRRAPELAREIVVLDKARHPRPKVCAGGVIPAGRKWLAEHDVAFDMPHVAVHRARAQTATATVEYGEP